MYTRLNNTITNAIKDVMSNSVCDFDNWWKDDFETEVYFETAEDFKNLSDTDLSKKEDCFAFDTEYEAKQCLRDIFENGEWMEDIRHGKVRHYVERKI